jgi:phosphinothricin acetyltransferase
MTAKRVVRSATRGDLPELVRIYNHYVENTNATFDTEGATVESRIGWFERFSEAGPHRLVVASEGDRVVGCASSGPYRDHPAFARTVEVSVYLHPELRSQGIGSALYGALLDQLRSQDVHVALAGIALPNDASVALHRKFGFKEVGVFEEYAFKNGNYISSVWMQLRFDGTLEMPAP